jgi:hypothetical protein
MKAISQFKIVILWWRRDVEINVTPVPYCKASVIPESAAAIQKTTSDPTPLKT